MKTSTNILRQIAYQHAEICYNCIGVAAFTCTLQKVTVPGYSGTISKTGFAGGRVVGSSPAASYPPRAVPGAPSVATVHVHVSPRRDGERSFPLRSSNARALSPLHAPAGSGRGASLGGCQAPGSKEVKARDPVDVQSPRNSPIVVSS
eukprot:938813-Rhodomonas_salina.1